MKTVNQVSKLAGVSIRTLHYYDKIGLLCPSSATEAGYRLYGDTDLERLQQILLFRELEFPLKEIKRILQSRDFDKKEALRQQIELLQLKKEHLENLIRFAGKLQETGDAAMNFDAFDTKEIDEYTKQAKEKWGNTESFKEYEQKSQGLTNVDKQAQSEKMTMLFTEFGQLMNQRVTDKAVQAQVKKLQTFITDNFYNCTNDILAGLGQIYVSGGEFTENIDKAGGRGCAEFVEKAINVYCKK